MGVMDTSTMTRGIVYDAQAPAYEVPKAVVSIMVKSYER